MGECGPATFERSDDMSGRLFAKPVASASRPIPDIRVRWPQYRKRPVVHAPESRCWWITVRQLLRAQTIGTACRSSARHPGPYECRPTCNTENPGCGSDRRRIAIDGSARDQVASLLYGAGRERTRGHARDLSGAGNLLGEKEGDLPALRNGFERPNYRRRVVDYDRERCCVCRSLVGHLDALPALIGGRRIRTCRR